jgi:hypothetical protein
VGSGAGLPSVCSQRLIADSNFPQLVDTAAVAIPTLEAEPEPEWFGPFQSEAVVVGSKSLATFGKSTCLPSASRSAEVLSEPFTPSNAFGVGMSSAFLEKEQPQLNA